MEALGERVSRRRQLWICWNTCFDCSSANLRIWTASSSGNKSCSQGLKRKTASMLVEWLFRAHNDKNRYISGLCAHSISGHRSQRRSFYSSVQRLCEDQHTLKQRGTLMRTEEYFVYVPDYSSNLLSVSRYTKWGHTFTFKEGERLADEIPEGNPGKTNSKNYLIY